MQANTSSIRSVDFSFLMSGSQSSAACCKGGQSGGGDGFSASLRLRLAEFRSQSVGALIGSGDYALSGDESNGLGALLSSRFDSDDLLAPAAGANAAGGLSATGRNLSLFDPESAYRMMTVIAEKDVSYRAQFSELSEMKAELVEMQSEGVDFASLSETIDGQQIKKRVEEFVAEFNEWTQRFDGDMAADGILAGTQAAQVSRYELRQSIQNPFFGINEGFHGLGDLGITIDPASQMAKLDYVALDHAIAEHRQGVVDTLQEFGHNFAESARLLNAEGNFIPGRLDNLDRVIDYIKDNKAALQAEFGLGDLAKPNGKVAVALAAYNKTYDRP